MPNASAPVYRGRVKSRLDNSSIGWNSPERIITLAFGTAPGAVGVFAFTAPRACKLVRIDYVADVNGAGASKIFVRKHVAGQVAAANAAVSGANIVDLVTGGIAADSTVRAPTSPALVTASTTMAAGDKLAVVFPATWVGALNFYVVLL